MSAFYKLMIFLIITYPLTGLSQSPNSAPNSTKGDYYFDIAEEFYKSSSHDSSSLYYELASEKYREEGKWKKYLMSSNYAALDFVYLSNYKKAENILGSCLTYCIDKYGEADTLTAVLFNSLGSVYYNQGIYEEALKGYGLSLKLRRNLFGDNHTITAASFLNVGLVWYWMGDYEKALEHFNKALSIWHPIYGDNNSNIGNCYINIANVYDALGESEKSIKYDLKALNSWKNVLGDQHRYIAMSYNNLAESYQTVGDYSKALDFAHKSLELNNTLFGSTHPQVAKNITLTAKILRKSNKLSEANDQIKEALKIWKNFPTNKDRFSTILGNAEINLDLGNYSEALVNFDSVIKATIPDALNNDYNPEKSFNIPAIRINYLYAFAGKGDVYFKKYKNSSNIIDLDSAFYWYNLYSKVIMQIRKSYRRESSKLNLNKLIHSNNKKLLATVFELYNETDDKKYKSIAYNICINSKAAVLDDAISQSGAVKFGNIPDSLQKKERYFQNSLESKYNELAYAEEDNLEQDAVSKIRTEIFDINKQYDLLIKNFEENFSSYYQLKYARTHLDLDYLQNKYLENNSAILEYFLVDQSTYIFLISKESIDIIKVDSPNLISSVKNFRIALSNLEFNEYLTEGHDIYNLLILPVKSKLRNIEKIHIIPDGILNYLPFEALITKEYVNKRNVNFGKINYLINEYEILYHYSINLFQQENNSDLIARNSFLGIAPVFTQNQNEVNHLQESNIYTDLLSDGTNYNRLKGKKYATLKYSENEVRNISSLFKSSNLKADIFLHSDAKENVVKSNNLQDYDILHIASHGFINEKRPRLSGILFWDDKTIDEDAILHLGEIYNLDLKLDLVVLSACESGLGKIVNGEGIIGFTRGFLFSGVKNIIISLWQVGDKSTAYLMEELYKNILNGFSYSQSLRLAKLKLINDSEYSYPLDWSPFVVIGQ